MSEVNLLDGKRILVVDDGPDILVVMRELLSMCDVVTSSSFDDGKEHLESQDFDIAILDIMGVDGYGLLDHCETEKHTSRSADSSCLPLTISCDPSRKGLFSVYPQK